MAEAETPSPFDRHVDHYTQMIEAVPHMRALGIRVVSAGQGSGAMRLPYDRALVGYRDTGIIAGGAVLTLMDSVGGLAVWSKLDRLALIATLDLRIDYLRPADAGEDLYGEATCYRLTRHIAFVEGRARHQSDERSVAVIKAKYVIDTATVDGVPA